MVQPHITALDAYYEHVAWDDPPVEYQSARLVHDEEGISLIAEWIEERERWEMRLSSTDGAAYRGTMKSKGYDPTPVHARLWELKDGWLWVGAYVNDAGEDEAIWIHAVRAEDGS